VNRLEPDAVRRVELVVAILLSAGLLALHLVVLTHAGPLWRDEISSLTLATKPSWKELWATLLYDPFPVLFFILLRAWHGIVGDWDLGLRILGCAIGCIGIASFWIGARLTGRTTPLVSLTMLGFAPVLITWGDSLRGYGLGIVWIAIVFGCFWRLLERPSGVRFFFAAGAAVMSVQSVFTNALLVFACAAAGIMIAVKRKAWRSAAALTGAGALAAVSMLPYVPTVLATQEWSRIRKINYPVSHHLQVLGGALSSWGAISFWLWIVLAGSVLATGMVMQFRRGTGRLQTEDRALASYAMMAAIIGSILTIAFFRIVSWPTNVWYYLPMLAVAALSINVMVDLIARDAISRLIKIVGAVLCLAIALPVIWQQLQTRASNIDFIAHTIEANEQPGDIVIVNPFTDAITFQRYYRGVNEYISVPPLKDLTLHRWDEVLEQMRVGNAMAPALEKMRVALRSGRRIWLVTNMDITSVKQAPPPVAPLDPQNPRPLGYFLFAWSRELTYELQAHATGLAVVPAHPPQPISLYEHDRLLLLSGWRDSAPPQSSP
jgi:hypothetical protein